MAGRHDPIGSRQNLDTSSQRLSQPDFASKTETWISTVAAAHPSVRAMALFPWPSARSAITSD
jgi:hypothetical protein